MIFVSWQIVSDLDRVSLTSLLSPTSFGVQYKYVSFLLGSEQYFSGDFFFFSFQGGNLTKKKSSFSCSVGLIAECVTFWTYLSISRNSSFPKRIRLPAKGYHPSHPSVSCCLCVGGKMEEDTAIPQGCHHLILVFVLGPRGQFQFI